MSRNLNIGAVLLVIYGAWGVLEGLMSSLMGEWYLENWMTMMNEEFLPPTISAIRDFSPKLLDFMLFVTQTYGLFVLFGSILFCIAALIPYRKGEKWAWYAVLVTGAIVSGAMIFMITRMTSHAAVSIVMIIIWIAGLAIPAKEILSKPS
jgi:hypothetical protein